MQSLWSTNSSRRSFPPTLLLPPLTRNADAAAKGPNPHSALKGATLVVAKRRSESPRLRGGGSVGGRGGDYKPTTRSEKSPSPLSKSLDDSSSSSSSRRVRAQSVYGFSNIARSHRASANIVSNIHTLRRRVSASQTETALQIQRAAEQQWNERWYKQLVGRRHGGRIRLRRQTKDSLNLGKPIAMPKPVLRWSLLDSWLCSLMGIRSRC